jgi:hypothetical protein
MTPKSWRPLAKPSCQSEARLAPTFASLWLTFLPRPILDNAISSIPGIGQQYSAAKWAIQTGQEIADTPQETTDAMAAAAQRPDQSSIATDWQAGSANVKTAYLGQQIIGLRDEITNLTRTAKERPDDQLIRQRLARAEDAYQRAYQMYDEASGQQFPQNPTFAALHDKDVPGTPGTEDRSRFPRRSMGRRPHPHAAVRPRLHPIRGRRHHRQYCGRAAPARPSAQVYRPPTSRQA